MHCFCNTDGGQRKGRVASLPVRCKECGQQEPRGGCCLARGLLPAHVLCVVCVVCVCVMGIVRVAFTRSSGSLVSLLCLKNMAYVCGGHRSMCLSESFTLNHTGPCTPLLFTSSLPSSLPHLHRSRNWCTSTWCATRRSSRI